MGLSRTAKILLGALLVAAAGFAWINFFNQGQLADGPQPAVPAAVVTPTTPAAGVSAPLAGALDSDAQGSTAAAPVDASPAVVASPVADDADADVVTAETEPEAATTATAVVAPAPDAADVAPPVIVTQAPTVVTRDLIVGDLPFLVTAPPAPQVEAAAEDAAGANRPTGTQRTSVNPFSPIIVQTPAPAPGPVLAQPEPEVVEIVTDAGVPATGPVITDVPAGTSGATATAAQPAPPPAAPAPRTIAPATATTTALPRPLPSGTLPVTPEILREARAPEQVAETPAPVDLGTLAAIRVPDEPEAQEPLPATESGADETTSVSTPEVLGTDRPNEPAAAAVEPEQGESSASTTPAPTLPLAIGGDPLSRYLRDNNVKFTGTVLGPLSVGVFRSARFSEPVVLTLGQTIPDTDIILTDLRGYEARFSLGDTTQTLSLDLRR